MATYAPAVEVLPDGSALNNETAVARVTVANSRASELLLASKAVVITDAVTAQDAADLRNEINAEEKAAEAARDALVRPLNQHVKWINDQFRPSSCMRKEALAILGKELGAWSDKQEAERLEAERLLREAQEKEQARLARLAEKAAARGDEAKAAEFEARAETVALAPTALPEADAPAGISYRTSYRAEVTDLKALLAAVVAGAVPAEAVVPDLKYLNATARATKGALRWPGVRFVAEKTVAATSTR